MLFWLQANHDGGPAADVRIGETSRDVRHFVRRYAAHQPTKESPVQKGEIFYLTMHFFLTDIYSKVDRKSI